MHLSLQKCRVVEDGSESLLFVKRFVFSNLSPKIKILCKTMEVAYTFAEKYTKENNTSSKLKAAVHFLSCEILKTIPNEENFGCLPCVCLIKNKSRQTPSSAKEH